MAWPATVTDAFKPNSAFINSIINALQTWGGNVNANTGNLSNLGQVTGAAGILPILSTKVGIGTAAPNVLLDVNGALGLRQSSLVLANGANHNVAIGTGGHIRIVGVTAAFNITGFANGTDGRILFVYSSTGQNFTVSHQNSGSSVGNRIDTGKGADLLVTTAGDACLLCFVYSAVDGWWNLQRGF